jgi:hypothetical protein
MLANQHGPQQRQSPLGRVSLATAYKDADLRRANQSVGATLTSGQLIWSWSTHTATANVWAVTLSADPLASSHLDPSRSPPPALTALQPVQSHPAADARKTSRLRVTQMPMQGRPTSSQSPRCRRKEDQPAHSCLAAEARKIDAPASRGRNSASIHGVHPALPWIAVVTGFKPNKWG